MVGLGVNKAVLGGYVPTRHCVHFQGYLKGKAIVNVCTMYMQNGFNVGLLCSAF